MASRIFWRVLADPPRHFDEDAMNFRQFVVEEPD